MTEHDAFELRVHAAVRGYAGRVTSDLDPSVLAHTIATTKPRRSGVAARWPLPVVAVPRLAWLLLLVAGLLAVTVGGLLVAGSRPQPERPAVAPVILPAAECPAGTNPDVPGPVSQARPPLSFISPMTFDRRGGQIVLLAEADPGPAQTWAFNVCSNTWTRMADGDWGAGWDALAYDADAGLVVTVSPGGSASVYDPAADTWTSKGRIPLDAFPSEGRVRVMYDPVSGHIVRALEPSSPDLPGLWTYDVTEDVWAPLASGGQSGDALLAYDASVDRLVVYDFSEFGPTTRLFNLRTGAWELQTATTPHIGLNWFTLGTEITYDEAARRTVINSGGIIAYDATTDTWSGAIDGPDALDPGACPGPRCRLDATTIYDPVNERLVIYGGIYQQPGADTGDAYVKDDSVMAFDLATRTWSTLLEATGSQPVY